VLQQSTHESEVVVAPWAAEAFVVIQLIQISTTAPVIKHREVDAIAVDSAFAISRLKMEHHGRVFGEAAITAWTPVFERQMDPFMLKGR
jgi:hypothetical protein